MESVRYTWNYILGTDVEPHRLDAATVKLFNVLMPVYSSENAETIDKGIDNFTAFPHVLDQGIRQRLKTRAIQCERIRTLDSFRADIIFLETCYNPLSKPFPMNKLCPANGTTLRKACQHSFKYATKFFQIHYVNLWLQAIRDYLYLSNLPSANPKKDRGKSKKAPTLKSEAKSLELALFAVSRGFETDEIDRQTANHTADIPQDIMSTDPPALTGDHDELPMYLRCNRSSESLFAKDRRFLHRQNIFDLRAEPRKKSATSFAVLRDIIICFFGRIPTLAPEDERAPLSLLIRVPPPNEEFAPVYHRRLVRPHSLYYDGSDDPPISESGLASSFPNMGVQERIDNTERLPQSHQGIEQDMDLSAIEAGTQVRSIQDGTTNNPDPTEGVSQILAPLRRPPSSIYDSSTRPPPAPGSPRYNSANDSDATAVEEIAQDPAISPRPASSIYSGSGQSPPPPTSPRYRSTSDGEHWSEADVPSRGDGAEGHAVGSSMDGGSFQAHELNKDELMPLSSDARSNWPASTEAETPTYPSQTLETDAREEQVNVDKGPDRPEPADETLSDVKKGGHRENPYRIEKPQQYTQKKKLKQQQKQILRALQDHDDKFRPTESQREYINLLDPEQTEVDDASSEVEPHNAQSRGVAEQSEVLPTHGEPPFCNHLSAGEAPVVSNLVLAIPQLVHDSSGIKVHSHNTEQDMQRGAN